MSDYQRLRVSRPSTALHADMECAQGHGPNARALSPTYAVNAHVVPGSHALPLGQAATREAYRPYTWQYNVAAVCEAWHLVAQVGKGGELG